MPWMRRSHHARTQTEPKLTAKWWQTCLLPAAIILLILSGVFFIGGWAHNQSSENLHYSTLDVKEVRQGTILGPLNVQAGDVLKFAFTAELASHGWAYVEVDILDGQEKTLFSFGDELWNEGYVGHDQLKYVHGFSQKGEYFVRLIEQRDSRHLRGLTLNVDRLHGNSFPYIVFGIVCLLAAVALNELRSQAILKILTKPKPVHAWSKCDWSHAMDMYVVGAVFVIFMALLWVGLHNGKYYPAIMPMFGY